MAPGGVSKQPGGRVTN